MKECPICQAVAFDDAKICYNCLHHYCDQSAPPPSSEQGVCPEQSAASSQDISSQNVPQNKGGDKRADFPSFSGWEVHFEFPGSADASYAAKGLMQDVSLGEKRGTILDVSSGYVKAKSDDLGNGFVIRFQPVQSLPKKDSTYECSSRVANGHHVRTSSDISSSPCTKKVSL